MSLRASRISLFLIYELDLNQRLSSVCQFILSYVTANHNKTSQIKMNLECEIVIILIAHMINK